MSEQTQGTILVIDDEPYILRSLSYLLQREGYSVQTASNGEEGLYRVRSLRPPLVFLDIMMPRMDGLELLANIKRDKTLAAIPVIMVTSMERREDQERGLSLGADAYIVKRKFDQRELLSTIRQIL